MLLDKIFGRKKRKSPLAGSGSSFSSVYTYFSQYMMLQQDRLAKLRDYREMGDYSDIAAFLDAIAEEAVQFDRLHGATVWIETKNDDLRKQFEIMLRRLDIEAKLQGIAYQLGKFGEVYFYNAVYAQGRKTTGTEDDAGIAWVLYDEPENVEPILDERRSPVGYKSQDIVPQNPESDGLLKLWEFTHFKILSSSLMIESGDSLLAPVRRTWRMLKMMEDSAVVYRLIKGPDRFVFYVDVGQSTPTEASKIVQHWKEQLRKRSYINPQTGQFDERWLGISVEEDIYWPLRRGNDSRVERLSGAGNLPHIEDIEYFRDKLYAGLKAPKAFFSQTDENLRGRALAMQDVWFARTVKRVQTGIIGGLRRMFDIHLAAQDIDPRREENAYKIFLHSPSNIEELQELDSIAHKFQIGQELLQFGQAANVDILAWLKVIGHDVLNLPKNLMDVLSTAQPLPALEPPDQNPDDPNAPVDPTSMGMAGDDDEYEEGLQKLGYIKDAVENRIASGYSGIPQWGNGRDNYLPSSGFRSTATIKTEKDFQEETGFAEAANGDFAHCALCERAAVGALPYKMKGGKVVAYPLCALHKNTDGYLSPTQPVLN